MKYKDWFHKGLHQVLFYQLKFGDEFFIDGEKYICINDGRNACNAFKESDNTEHIIGDFQKVDVEIHKIGE